MRINEILNELEEAYSTDVFPDIAPEERLFITKSHPGLIDCASAAMGRHLAKVIREKLAEPIEDDEEMSDTERADRLEAMLDRVADKLVNCTVLIRPVYDLCQQIESCGASEELTKASTMASDILHKLMDAVGVRNLAEAQRKEQS